MSRQAAIARAERFFDDGGFRDDLARWVAFRTESQVPESRPQLGAYLAQEIAPSFARMGFEVRIMDNPVAEAGPFLVATRREGDGLPTMLGYGHGDVIRGLEPQWRQGLNPWTLTVEGDRWYGRGTADNKSQHLINIRALETVIRERGKLGFNCTFLVETGEEMGSPGLHEFCARNKELLGADILIASDGPRLKPGQPTIFMGSRGAFNFDMTVDLRAGGHHSGNWGGLLANPGVILAHAIASIIDAKGRVIARDILPKSIPNSVRAALAGLEVDGGADGPTIDPWWGEPGLSEAEKVFGWNTFEVLAFKTGNPDNPVNAIPPAASAHCQIRFTVDVHPDTFIPSLRRHLDKHGFQAVKLSAARKGHYPATRLDPEHPAAQWASASVAATTGKKPALLPNLGGTLPNDCFADILGMPTIWVPHSYASCSQHAPNEHVLAPLMREGLRMMTGLFWDLGEKPPVTATHAH
ncbi:MAG: M20 family metallopeptidase [Alphaproteobacteria bacterium]|nr:M20 family metallopeptidase [Alphaproteobacteria bacterium]